MGIGKKIPTPFRENDSANSALLSIKNPPFSETQYTTVTSNYLTRILYKLGVWERPKEWHFVWRFNIFACEHGNFVLSVIWTLIWAPKRTVIAKNSSFLLDIHTLVFRDVDVVAFATYQVS